jgi:hypothetical protein
MKGTTPTRDSGPDPRVWHLRAAEYRAWAERASGEEARRKWLKLAEGCDELARRIADDRDSLPVMTRLLSGRR